MKSLFTDELGSPYLIEAVVHFEPITDLENYIGNCEFVEYFSMEQ